MSDLTGQRFERLVAMERVPKPEHRKTRGSWWRCRCDCGREAIVHQSNLLQCKTGSCGCKRREGVAERNVAREGRDTDDQIREKMKDLVGKTIGALEVMELVQRPPDATTYTKAKYWYRCRCECKKVVTVARQYLRETGTPSCGCQAATSQRHVRKISMETKDLLRVHETDPKVRAAAYRRHELAEEMRRAINGRVCETCKKEFDCYAGEDWAWKFQHKGRLRHFCSYGCMRKYEKKHMQQTLDCQYW